MIALAFILRTAQAFSEWALQQRSQPPRRRSSLAVISLFIAMPVKLSVCFSAKAVNSVTTSPELSTSGDTTPSPRATASHKSLSNSFLNISACFEKAALAGVKPALKNRACSFMMRPKNKCSSRDSITKRSLRMVSYKR